MKLKGNRVLLALQILHVFSRDLDFQLGVDEIFIGHGIAPKEIDVAARRALKDLEFEWDPEVKAWKTWM